MKKQLILLLTLAITNGITLGASPSSPNPKSPDDAQKQGFAPVSRTTPSTTSVSAAPLALRSTSAPALAPAPASVSASKPTQTPTTQLCHCDHQTINPEFLLFLKNNRKDFTESNKVVEKTISNRWSSPFLTGLLFGTGTLALLYLSPPTNQTAQRIREFMPFREIGAATATGLVTSVARCYMQRNIQTHADYIKNAKNTVHSLENDRKELLTEDAIAQAKKLCSMRATLKYLKKNGLAGLNDRVLINKVKVEHKNILNRIYQRTFDIDALYKKPL